MSMQPDLPETTMIEAARYVDGQLDKSARAAFELEMQRDPRLLRAVEATRALRAPFAAAAADLPPGAPPGFKKRVLQAVRRLPGPEEGGSEALPDGQVALLVRRSLVAAALIFGLGLLMFAGLLRRADSSRLEASPGTHQKLLDDLDQKIKARLEKSGPENR